MQAVEQAGQGFVPEGVALVMMAEHYNTVMRALVRSET